MSEKGIAAKLLVKPGYRVLLINAPASYAAKLTDLPVDVALGESKAPPDGKEPADLVQIFVCSKKELETSLEKTKGLLKPSALLWVTYPKGTSKAKADINRDSINAYANTVGLQGVAMIAIDETWSALRLKPRA